MRERQGLDRLERWMQAVVMHPGGAAQGLQAPGAKRLSPEAVRDVESVVTRSKRLSAVDRLGIYASMYYIRLIEVLTAEYPTVKTVLGEEAFERACRAFLLRHPSTERTLQSLSIGFPAFLKRHLRGRRNARLAVDAARIERAMEEVFDAPRAEPVSYETFRQIPLDRWGEVSLALTPALRLLKLDCDADGYMTALRTRARPRAPRASTCYAVVYRHKLRAWRMSVTREQYLLLESLGSGAPIGRAVYRSCRDLKGPADKLGARLAQWFKQWAAEGLFVDIRETSQI